VLKGDKAQDRGGACALLFPESSRRSSCRWNGFTADVTAADERQAGGDVLDVQRSGRVHHAQRRRNSRDVFQIPTPNIPWADRG